jgi:hypothetical protein
VVHIPLYKILELELDAEKCLKVKVVKNSACFFSASFLFFFSFLILLFSAFLLCTEGNNKLLLLVSKLVQQKDICFMVDNIF